MVSSVVSSYGQFRSMSVVSPVIVSRVPFIGDSDWRWNWQLRTGNCLSSELPKHVREPEARIFVTLLEEVAGQVAHRDYSDHPVVGIHDRKPFDLMPGHSANTVFG